MQAVLITAPSFEPVSLDELKLHLKIDLDVLDEDEYLEDLIKAGREHVEEITRRAIINQTWEYYLEDWPDADYIKLPFGNLQSILSLTIADSACVEADGTYNLIFTGTNKTTASGTYTIATNVITATSLTSGGTGYLTAPTVATQTGDGSITATLATVKWKDDDGTETTLTANTDYLIECNGDQCGRIVLPYGESWPSGTLYPSNPIAIKFLCGWPTAETVPFKIKAAIKMKCAQLYEGRGEDIVGQTIIENKRIDDLLFNSRLWEEF